MNKWVALLQSRKFWASVISIGVAFGVLEYSDSQQSDLVQALVVVGGAVGYIISLALEDGMGRLAESQAKIADAQRLTKIQEAIETYNERRAERQDQARERAMARR